MRPGFSHSRILSGLNHVTKSTIVKLSIVVVIHTQSDCSGVIINTFMNYNDGSLRIYRYVHDALIYYECAELS